MVTDIHCGHKSKGVQISNNMQHNIYKRNLSSPILQITSSDPMDQKKPLTVS